jgi:hypothetical protein
MGDGKFELILVPREQFVCNTYVKVEAREAMVWENYPL